MHFLLLLVSRRLHCIQFYTKFFLSSSSLRFYLFFYSSKQPTTFIFSDCKRTRCLINRLDKNNQRGERDAHFFSFSPHTRTNEPASLILFFLTIFLFVFFSSLLVSHLLVDCGVFCNTRLLFFVFHMFHHLNIKAEPNNAIAVDGECSFDRDLCGWLNLTKTSQITLSNGIRSGVTSLDLKPSSSSTGSSSSSSLSSSSNLSGGSSGGTSASISSSSSVLLPKSTQLHPLGHRLNNGESITWRLASPNSRPANLQDHTFRAPSKLLLYRLSSSLVFSFLSSSSPTSLLISLIAFHSHKDMKGPALCTHSSDTQSVNEEHIPPLFLHLVPLVSLKLSPFDEMFRFCSFVIHRDTSLFVKLVHHCHYSYLICNILRTQVSRAKGEKRSLRDIVFSFPVSFCVSVSESFLCVYICQ